ncbi:hypothetical protein K440DRAFT_165324 [Wilcoxina mikolae CBS 423.85]|nr:hypothetical protein K440DRAFT_165324 [Wilcoxina mikolae CBS 423.85]
MRASLSATQIKLCCAPLLIGANFVPQICISSPHHHCHLLFVPFTCLHLPTLAYTCLSIGRRTENPQRDLTRHRLLAPDSILFQSSPFRGLQVLLATESANRFIGTRVVTCTLGVTLVQRKDGGCWLC